jgi:hypothetical protein
MAGTGIGPETTGCIAPEGTGIGPDGASKGVLIVTEASVLRSLPPGR